jgi:hypothetical protein
MRDFAEQVERIAMMGGLLLFGGALVNGLLSPLIGAGCLRPGSYYS